MDRTSLNFVIAAYSLTWVVLGAFALHALTGVRRARAQYDQAARRTPASPGRTT